MKVFRLKNPLRNRNNVNYHYDPRKHGVSQSILEAWLVCREKSRLVTLQGWTNMGSSKPLTFGDLSHGILERIYKGIRAKKIKTPKAAIALVPTYAEEARQSFFRSMPRVGTATKDLVEECLATLLMQMPLYCDKWLAEDLQLEWILVEDKFSIPVKTDHGIVPMIGKFDGVVRKGKKVGVFETKNKSQWSAELLDLLPLDLQLSYYTAACHHKKMDPQFVLYNLIRRPGERRGVAESLKMFTERIASNIHKKPEHYFERYEEQLTAKDVAQYVARANALVRAFTDWFVTNPHTERDLLWNSFSCENKYGVCNLLPICSKGDHEGHYIRENASPELVEK
jgi:PD-(D/E)XK nuclease superfamily